MLHGRLTAFQARLKLQVAAQLASAVAGAGAGAVALALALAAVAGAGTASAREQTPEWAAGKVAPVYQAAQADVAVAALPPEAQHTYRLIWAGGPFPYSKDGSVFGNRERLLPRHPRGYWREYTVKTPGVRHRGARRIVCGGTPPNRPEACYYTADHYANFSLIVDSHTGTKR